MSKFKIQWEGLEEMGDVFQRALDDHPDLIQNVIKKNGELLQAKAKHWAPKPGGSRYGPNPYAEGPLSGNIEATYPGRFVAEVNAAMGYAGYVNFGTRKMRAQPFMTDSVQWLKPHLEKDAKDVVEGMFK